MGEPLQTSHTATSSGPSSVCRSASSSLWLLTWPEIDARHQVLFAVCLSTTSLLALARLCQAHRLILGTGRLSATLWPLLPPLLLSFVCLPSSATESKVCLDFMIRAESDAPAPLSSRLSLYASPQRLIRTTG